MFQLHTSRNSRNMTSFNRQLTNSWILFFLIKKNCHVYDILNTNYSLPHGQLSIERGFSINKEHLPENVQEESLIVPCMVNDHKLANNLAPNNQILQAMFENVKASNRRYKNKLQERRDTQNKDMQSCKESSYCSKFMRLLKRKACC